MATSWSDLIGAEKEKPYFKNVMQFVRSERAKGKSIYPPHEQIFAAFEHTTADQVKAVILGQDPYHGPGQAHGLCFSVNKGVPFPPSLRNIFQELHSDLGLPIPAHGDLTAWAKQGVLLLNTVLTVEQGKPQSHQNMGWEQFTDTVIQSLNQLERSIVFLLWGASAQKKARLIDTSKHHVLKAPHPSPLSAHRGFFGCKHFSRCNEILVKQGEQPINWQID